MVANGKVGAITVSVAKDAGISHGLAGCHICTGSGLYGLFGFNILAA
jgi:hypothetical protein